MIKIKSVKNLTAPSRKVHRAMPALETTKDGRLLIAFREGSDHVDSADGCLKLLSSDDGEKWEEKTLIAENPRFDVRVNHGMAKINDRIYLPYQQYKMKRDSPECRTLILTSEDGEDWKKIRVKGQLPYFYPYGKMFVCNNHLLVPSYFSMGYNQPLSYSTIRDLNGKAWNLAFNPKLRFNEADVCKVNGKFLAVIREEKKGFAYTSRSKNAREWSKPVRLPFALQSPCLLKVKDRILLAGRELALYRQKFGFKIAKTLGTTIRESFDNGKTWSEPLFIGKSYFWDCGYPSMIEYNGQVLCAFYSEFAYGNSDLMLAKLEVLS